MAATTDYIKFMGSTNRTIDSSAVTGRAVIEGKQSMFRIFVKQRPGFRTSFVALYEKVIEPNLLFHSCAKVLRLEQFLYVER